MDVRQLFIAKTDELRELLNAAHEYNLLKSSAIVRHLIMDGGALTKQVSRLSGEPIIFPVASGGMVEHAKSITGDYPMIFTVGDSIFPADYRHARPWKNLKIDAFLKEQVLVLDGMPYTIKDVIDFTAHVAGGVHTNPINDRMRALKASNSGAYILGLPPTEMLMRSIGRSVLHACFTNELWCLNNLGREALASGYPHAATSYFERLVLRASEKNLADQAPAHFEVFKANLEDSRTKAALIEHDPT